MPPDILTYRYDSRMVYVLPAETYDKAIDLAQETFPELRDVERNRIHLEVRVVLTRSSNEHRQTAEIGRSVWSVVVSTLAQYEIIEIRLANPPGARSSLHPSVVAEPPPYETGGPGVADEKAFVTNPFSSGSQTSGSSSQSQSHPQPQSLTSRLASLLSRSSRGRYSS